MFLLFCCGNCFFFWWLPFCSWLFESYFTRFNLLFWKLSCKNVYKECFQIFGYFLLPLLFVLQTGRDLCQSNRPLLKQQPEASLLLFPLSHHNHHLEGHHIFSKHFKGINGIEVNNEPVSKTWKGTTWVNKNGWQIELYFWFYLFFHTIHTK